MAPWQAATRPPPGVLLLQPGKWGPARLTPTLPQSPEHHGGQQEGALPCLRPFPPTGEIKLLDFTNLMRLTRHQYAFLRGLMANSCGTRRGSWPRAASGLGGCMADVGCCPKVAVWDVPSREAPRDAAALGLAVTLQTAPVPFAGWGASPSPHGTDAPRAIVCADGRVGDVVVSHAEQGAWRGVCLSVCAASGAPSFLKALWWLHLNHPFFCPSLVRAVASSQAVWGAWGSLVFVRP